MKSTQEGSSPGDIFSQISLLLQSCPNLVLESFSLQKALSTKMVQGLSRWEVGTSYRPPLPSSILVGEVAACCEHLVLIQSAVPAGSSGLRCTTWAGLCLLGRQLGLFLPAWDAKGRGNSGNCKHYKQNESCTVENHRQWCLALPCCHLLFSLVETSRCSLVLIDPLSFSSTFLRF